MDIENFLNPVDKLVEDDLATIDDVVLNEFLPEVNEDEIEDQKARILYSEAIQALKTLCLYEEQQDQGETYLINALHKHERVLEVRRIGEQKQRDIRSYFGV
ncbi:uncharacterized protein N7500_004415 [Penicillium coprophilum]|uniref:uncharacterized protein n=1 Tax=Penicillium coprophilum TaxID=36646 RepID=UPI002382D28F|nr:uncharacterized protein N7500_004415 [Penicillium coprophilum]KAJ5162585.1 hypothetical protein N7500_004415 [Penicillium coprophilum]